MLGPIVRNLGFRPQGPLAPHELVGNQMLEEESPLIGKRAIEWAAKKSIANAEIEQEVLGMRDKPRAL